jgi:uncharacterized protein YutE (UPF0331/DUF86 family)
MKINKLNKNTKYMAILEVQDSGAIKIEKAEKLTPLNQFKNTWLRVDARNVARGINNSKLVIK